MATNTPGEMPFLDHLEELRWRIIYSLVALVIGVAIGFVLVIHFDAITLIERPILPFLHGRKLVYTHPSDPFNIVLSTSIAVGIVVALPVIIYQVWAFISPALYKHEKHVAIPVILGAVLLFVCGVSLSYFVVLPLALDWLLGFQTASLEPMITASEYFDFVVSMSIAFGAAFELPILILGLSAFGIVTPAFLNRFRRHAIVICVIVGAFLTPGDMVWTTIAMTVPLYLLYELSIVLSVLVDRRRRRRALMAEQTEATA